MDAMPWDGPAGRAFHGLAGDTPIFRSEKVYVDQFDDGKVFVEVGGRDLSAMREYMSRSEAIRMARAILERLKAES